MRTRLALLALCAGALPLAAQGSAALYTRWNALSGFEFQRYHFTDSLGANKVSTATQWSIPLVVVAPLGRRMSVDVTTRLAHNEVAGSSTQTFTGLTDTQLRLLYTVGRDRAVATLSFNLPTGTHSFSTAEFPVSSSMSSPFLSFPVSNLGSGFGVTGGLAYTVGGGGWNLGLAGSVRYGSSYKPFSDQAVTYNPGLEARLRVGADRLIGQRGRLLVGATYSSFSTDQFSGSGIVSGWFNPGPRFIVDAGYGHSLGRATVAFGVWNYYRGAGSAAGGTDAKENVLNAELRVGYQVARRLVLEPLVGFRQWNPGNVRGGRLYSFGLTARVGISDQLSGQVSGRFAPGWIYDAGTGQVDLSGTGMVVYLRYQR